MNEAAILASLMGRTDSDLLDDVDDIYDDMVAASERGDEAEYRRLQEIHTYATAYLVARGLIGEV